MIVPGSTNPLLMRSAAPAAYQISRSLRFNSADSPYLSRTPASAGNRKTWTWAGWIKRSLLNADEIIFDANNGTNYISLTYRSGEDTLQVYSVISGSTYQLISTAKYRDTSAWTHVVLAYDTTQATASNRVRLYVDGSQLTVFNTATYPPQNADTMVNNTVAHQVSGRSGGTTYLNAYLADVHLIDGQALTSTSFTEVSATTGQLVPKAYSGSYGTNGFHLEFADNSGTTSTTLGKDTSGNSNNFTPSGFSVTAGSGNDSLTDTPTSYGTDTGTGAEVRGNYASWSPLYGATPTLLNGNLEASVNATTAYSSISVTSGKWYWEITPTGGVSTNTYIGIIDSTYIKTDALWSSQARCYVSNANKYDGSTSSYGASYTANDVIGVALDVDAGTLVFYKNGTSQGTAFSTGLTGKEWKALAYSGGSATHIANFGQRAFAYTAPSGFKALVDTNLTAPTIAKPSTVFDVVTYTGTGSALTPTSSLGFSPDLIWIKSRSAATDHTLYDTVRGAEKRLESNTTDAEVTSDGGVTAFNSNGFTLGTLAQVNTNAATYVGWCWDGGTSTVTNTNGTITSSVRANASAGISIVGYTGTGTAGTVGHGLGVTPGMVIVKSRGNPGTSDAWATYMTGASATAGAYLLLEKASAVATSSVVFNGTNPTSSVFSIGNWAGTNSNGLTYIAYCFAPVSGFSSFGSYTGNGSADGPFVYLGFRPGWILVKASSTGGSTYDWFVYDTERDTYNAASKFLSPNYLGAEQVTGDAGTLTDVYFDILSNGFKVRNNRGRVNLNATTFVYAAFAEYPFAYARAR